MRKNPTISEIGAELQQADNDKTDRAFFRLLRKLDKEILVSPATGMDAQAAMARAGRAVYWDRTTRYIIAPIGANDAGFSPYGYTLCDPFIWGKDSSCWGKRWFPSLEAAIADVADTIEQSHHAVISKDWRQRAKYRPYDAQNWS